MKTQALLIMIFASCAVIAKGQTPKGELYWVVESNHDMPDFSIVKIYDAKDILVHEVKLNTRIDITKRRHRKTLVQIVKDQSTRLSAGIKREPSDSQAKANAPL